MFVEDFWIPCWDLHFFFNISFSFLLSFIFSFDLFNGGKIIIFPLPVSKFITVSLIVKNDFFLVKPISLFFFEIDFFIFIISIKLFSFEFLLFIL